VSYGVGFDMERFLGAVVQMVSGADRAANVRTASALIRDAARRGARLIVLPEVFAWRGTGLDDPTAAEPIPGPTSEAMSALARELGVVLCMGSILETVPGETRRYNTSCLLDASGTIVARYRKIHLFDVVLPDRVAVQESATRLAGDTPTVVTTPLARLGCSICYDLRFPELYRTLALAGAEVLAVPSNFTERTGRDHWEVLLRARAIENGAWVVAPGQSGGPPGNPSFGRSMIVDPWGTVVAQAADGVGIVRADVETDSVAAVRRQIPSLANRRPETYRSA
jgi:predicted amidohydrolase